VICVITYKNARIGNQVANLTWCGRSADVTAQRYISPQAKNSTKRVVDALANALPTANYAFGRVGG